MSLYFLNLLKSLNYEMLVIICNARCRDGSVYWTNQDMHDLDSKHISYTKQLMVGGCSVAGDKCFIRRAHILAALKFQYDYPICGTVNLPIDHIMESHDDKFDMMLSSIFLQMLNISKSTSLCIGNAILIEKQSAYDHLMSIDLNS